jgi:hypothetical protein
MKLVLTVGILGLALSAAAVITEDSASASALGGITMLSESVSDYGQTPIVGKTGVAFSYHRAFGNADSNVFSLNQGSGWYPFIVSSGVSYLNHPDYRWEDFHLGLGLHYQTLALGYTQHLIHEKISTGDSYNTWTGDLALSFWGEEYGTEVRIQHIGALDAQLHLTAGTKFADGVLFATDYVYRPHAPDCYSAATSYNIGSFMLVQSSWQSEPPRFGMGIKLMAKGAEVMYAIRTHPDLSMSHSVDLGFSW